MPNTFQVNSVLEFLFYAISETMKISMCCWRLIMVSFILIWHMLLQFGDLRANKPNLFSKSKRWLWELFSLCVSVNPAESTFSNQKS
uniref:Uncharacterized protein n=1 Tax=Aster yellows phytoplasma TaxID=35779 RepID=Q847N7_ASTYP|nr:hypothetical protein [Aster yellows phytoplasma]